MRDTLTPVTTSIETAVWASIRSVSPTSSPKAAVRDETVVSMSESASKRGRSAKVRFTQLWTGDRWR